MDIYHFDPLGERDCMCIRVPQRSLRWAWVLYCTSNSSSALDCLAFSQLALGPGTPALAHTCQAGAVRTRFERKHATATDGRVATTAIEVAHFLGEMGRGVAAATMYQTILNQPLSVLNASVESRHQVVFLPTRIVLQVHIALFTCSRLTRLSFLSRAW